MMELQQDGRDLRTIFVSIPAYRDPETVFTIADLFKKAREPQFLHVAVLWQSSPEDVGAMPALGDLEKMSDQIKVKQIEASRARGPSWARYLIQKEMFKEGEFDFYFQIDSHTRFVQDWDVILKDMWRRCDDEMAVLTTYPCGYTNDSFDYSSVKIPTSSFDDQIRCIASQDRAVLHLKSTPTILCVDQEKGWDENRMLRLRARSLKASASSEPISQQSHSTNPRKKTQRSLFWAAGYSFSRSHVVSNAPYEQWPALFFGEEFAMACKMFKSGYNFYAPDQVLLYHLWDRNYRPGHTPVSSESSKEDQRSQSQARVMDILTDDTAVAGDGVRRSLEEYKEFCGVDFESRTCLDIAYRGGCSEDAFVSGVSSSLAAGLLETVMNMNDRVVPSSSSNKPSSNGATELSGMPNNVLDNILRLASLDGTGGGIKTGGVTIGSSLPKSPMSPTTFASGRPPNSPIPGMPKLPPEPDIPEVLPDNVCLELPTIPDADTIQVNFRERFLHPADDGDSNIYKTSLAHQFNFPEFNRRGYVVIDNFSKMVAPSDFLLAVKHMRETTTLRPAQMGTAGDGERFSNESLRGDRIAWLPEIFPAAPVGFDPNSMLLQAMHRFMAAINDHTDFHIKRVSTMLAMYPGEGERYVKHLDNVADDPEGRIITICLYLNENYSKEHGGEIVLYDRSGSNEALRVEPLFNRVVMFDSRKVPHEVLECRAQRWALTFWLYGETRYPVCGECSPVPDRN